MPAVANRVTSLLTGLTPDQIRAMSPADAQCLSDQCERVHRLINVERIIADARNATAEPGGVLSLLKRGDRAP